MCGIDIKRQRATLAAWLSGKTMERNGMERLTRTYCSVTENLTNIESRFRQRIASSRSEFAAVAYAEGARLLLKERHAHIAGCQQCLEAERRAA